MYNHNKAAATYDTSALTRYQGLQWITFSSLISLLYRLLRLVHSDNLFPPPTDFLQGPPPPGPHYTPPSQQSFSPMGVHTFTLSNLDANQREF